MASLYTPVIAYDPVKDPNARRANHYQIERSPGDTFVYECLADPMTRFPTPFYHPDALIIAAAGSYQSDRHCYPGPRAGYAVFVGPFNKLNTGGMPVAKVPGQWISLQRGELAGAVAAMEVVMKILDRGSATDKPLRRVVVKTDSEYVVKGITDRAYTWLQKGWIGNGNSRVRDWDLWEELLRLLNEIEGRWGVWVRFWLVPRLWNQDAKREAHHGIRAPPPDAMVVHKSEQHSSPTSFDAEFIIKNKV